MLTDQKRAEILSRFIELCLPAEPTDPLKFLGFDEHVFANPPAPEHILSVLLEAFAISDLIDCGIVIASEDEPARISPELAQAGGMFIVLRDIQTQEPYALLRSQGVASRAISIRSALRDAQTLAAIDDDEPHLFAAFTVEDVAVLRACGLPAILASDLDKLPLDQVDDFCDALGIEREKSERAVVREIIEAASGNESEFHPDDPIRRMFRGESDSPQKASPMGAVNFQQGGGKCLATKDEKITLVFVDWRVASLAKSDPCELKAVVDHFEKLSKYLGVDLWEISYWSVEDEDLEQLQFIAEGESVQIFKETLEDLAFGKAEPLSSFGNPKAKRVGPPEDFPAAMTHYFQSGLQTSGGLQCSSHERKRAWDDSQRLMNEQVIQPLREYAMKTDNPLEQMLLLSAADISQVVHVQATLVGDKLSRRIAERGETVTEPLADEDLKSLLSMTDRLVNIAKAADQCRRQNIPMLRTKVIESPTIPRLPHSG